MADGGQEHWWEPYSAEMLATILKTITLKAEADQDDIEARLQSAAIFFKRGRNRSVQAPSEQIREWERLALRLQGVEQDFASMPIIPEKGDLIYSIECLAIERGGLPDVEIVRIEAANITRPLSIPSEDP